MNCTGGITSLDILKNGWTLGVGTMNGYLHLYDLRNMEVPILSAKAHDTSVYCIKFIPNLSLPVVSSHSSGSKEFANTKTSYSSSACGINANTSILPTSEGAMKRSNSYNNYEMSTLSNSNRILPITLVKMFGIINFIK